LFFVSLCLGGERLVWGLTPDSQGDEIRAASPVNPFGRLERDAAVFGAVPDGAEVKIERA
jgi:hypothetical protein